MDAIFPPFPSSHVAEIKTLVYFPLIITYFTRVFTCAFPPAKRLSFILLT